MEAKIKQRIINSRQMTTSNKDFLEGGKPILKVIYLE